MMLKAFQFVVGLIILITLEVLRVYYIMPFPGSQQSDSIGLAYFLHQNMFWLRTIGISIIFFPMIHFYLSGSTLSKWLVSIGLVLYLYAFMMFNYKMQADKMFYQPKLKSFASEAANTIPGKKLVLGLEIGGEAKAYPIEVIGYHHQIRDTIGGTPVMITYCTVCRTGRAFSPMVNGKSETFRLVGMDHFNAMFEDESTGSWWRQVNGQAVAGPLKGSELTELPSEQMSLAAWILRHPDSKILQPDSNYREEYAAIDLFDEGTMESGLEGRDTLSWKDKSWIVGVAVGRQARAYDWNQLVAARLINDTLGSLPILIAVESDSVSFHVWERDSLTFKIDTINTALLRDDETSTEWNWLGEAVSGKLKGSKLKHVQAYQEFWHSWKTFRPSTTQYKSLGN